MNSRSRVHDALTRESADRVPIWMWFHPETTVRLSNLLEIPPARVADALGDDVRQTWVGNNYFMEGVVHERDGETHTDPWGIEWVKEGPFNQIRYSPLQRADASELLRYEFPYGHTDELLASMEPVVAMDGEHFIGCDISPCLLEMAFRIRGMGEILLDLVATPRLAQTMIERAGAFSVHLASIAIDRFSPDWLWAGDDVGGQLGMIVSPGSWREMIRPHLADIFQVGKSKGKWVAYHCCGAIRPIIPDLIEIGLDVLNPIQCNCPGMDPLELKRDFGGELSFMGGVDTQQLLPRGTPEEVHRDTVRLVEGMTSDGGGYILAASHAVPPETPTENVFAMYDAVGVTREVIFDRAADIRIVLDDRP